MISTTTRRLAAALLACALLLSACTSQETYSGSDQPFRLEISLKRPETAVQYQIQAQALDLAAVDSYPQTIIETISATSPYRLVIEVQPDEGRVQPTPLEDYDYPADVARYLEPTELIESDSEAVKALAVEIAPGETDIPKIAAAAAAWTAKNIKYDNGLAQQIWNGSVDTQSAVKTLERRQGTCSEYANAFIAIMRSKGIPTRFVTGFVYGGMYHAWAEFYLQDVGWVPVDPQMGKVGVSPRHIKLFTSVDFAEIGVKLQEINIQISKR